MTWTADAAAVILAPELYWAVQVSYGDTDPPPFVTLPTKDQDWWIFTARAVIDVLAKPASVVEDTPLTAAAAITRKFAAIKGGKID
jgi:hypothetical protein